MTPFVVGTLMALGAATVPQPAPAQQPSPPQASQSQQPSPQQPQALQRFTATVTGPVTSIDAQQGRLGIRGPDGVVNLRFPPAALQKLNLKQADSVTVGFGFMETPQAAASPRTEEQKSPSTTPSSPAKPETGAQAEPPQGVIGTVKGEVTSVDSQTGRVALKTDDGTVNLQVPPPALQGLKQGDKLTLGVALTANR